MKNVFLGEYVKQRRLDLGLTQEQLCYGICEPEDLPTPQPGVTETEQPDGSDQPENPDRPSIQPCDAMPGVGDMG